MPDQSTNVDPAELAKFDELASRWWDPEGDFKPLHDLNPLRLGYIDDRVELMGQTVLDVGCGGGILAEAMDERGAIVTGIDVGKGSLTVARLHQLESETKIDYRQITAEELALQEPCAYDIVTCMELLEHVPDPGSLIRACATLLKPNGHAFFSTINRNPKAYLLAIVGAEYILRLLPKGTHDYGRFIRPSELDAWARQARLELLGLAGVSYNPLTAKYTLGANVDVNYIAYTRRH